MIDDSDGMNLEGSAYWEREYDKATEELAKTRADIVTLASVGRMYLDALAEDPGERDADTSRSHPRHGSAGSRGTPRDEVAVKPLDVATSEGKA